MYHIRRGHSWQKQFVRGGMVPVASCTEKPGGQNAYKEKYDEMQRLFKEELGSVPKIK